MNGPAFPFVGINNINGSHTPDVLCVSHSITNRSYKEVSEETSSLLIDETIDFFEISINGG